MSTETIKVPVFNKDTTFTVWWMRFKAYAALKKFLAAIQETAEDSLPMDEVTELVAGQDDAAIAAKNRNAMAVAALTLALPTGVLMMHVHKACDANWPGGLAWKVVKSLFKKFRPKDTISKVELRMMLNKITMKEKDEPDKLFEQIGEVQQRYSAANMTVDEADLMAVVFTVAPKKYQAVLSSVQMEKGEDLDLDDLESTMNQVYRQESAVRKKSDEDSQEIALAAMTGQKCWYCQELGHISRDCPKKKKNNGNRNPNNSNNGGGKKCGICQKPHDTSACWEKPENAHKRPKWYKTKGATQGEVGAMATGGEGGKTIELMLAGMSFPTTLKILDDPNIWIADTGTTVHNTPYLFGIKGQKVAKDEALTMGNGKAESTSVIGDLAGTMCDHKRIA